MSKPISLPITFAPLTGPIPLANLDSNFTALQASINDTATYVNFLTDSGVVNAITVTIPGSQTFSYGSSTKLTVKVAVTNTGATTLTVATFGTKNVKNADGTALIAGQIVANGVYDFVFDVAADVFVLQTSSKITSAAIDVTANYTWSGTHTWSNNTLSHSIAGKLTIGTPSAGAALTVTGLTGQNVIVGRSVGATNNPGVFITPTEATGQVDINASSSAGSPFMTLSTSGTIRLTVANAGNITVAQPSSGVALTVNAVAGQRGINVNGASGSNSLIQFADNGTNKFSTGWVGGAGQFWIFDDVASATRMSLSTSGNFVFSAPSSGVALTVSGASNANVISATASGTGAALVANGVVQDTYRKYKTATTGISNSTTLTDDADLQVALPVGTYQGRVRLLFTGTTTNAQGYKCGLAFTGTLSSSAMCYTSTFSGTGTPQSAASAIGSSTPSGSTVLTGPSQDVVLMDVWLTVSAAGAFKVQWCQANSNANNTNLIVGSSFTLERIA